MLISRNVTVHRRRTSMRLEPEYWDALEALAARRDQTVHELVSDIASAMNPGDSLTSAVRVEILRALSNTGGD